MAVIKIPPERKEQFTLTLHPETRYLSSSLGTSGSMPIKARSSKAIKDLVAAGVLGEATFSPNVYTASRAYNADDFLMIEALASARLLAYWGGYVGESQDVTRYMETYMSGVSQSPTPVRNTKRLYITRFDPPFSLNDVAIEKAIIRENLFPFYAVKYDLSEMAYTNYHSLNFMSAPVGSGYPGPSDIDVLPDNSAIIYQNFSQRSGTPQPFAMSGAFSIDFYINPKYPNQYGQEFKAGTIFHHSSSFALSLISGSGRDANGLVDGYRLMLQLSHSADIAPSTVNVDEVPGPYPNNLIFTTPDNSLKRNNWHHITVRWGSEVKNNGTGSIIIDDSKSDFFVPSASILSEKNGNALFVGNYYEGYENDALYFNDNVSSEGVYPTLDFGGAANFDPENAFLRHPLNAEIHELKIYKKLITDEEIASVGDSSPLNFKNLLFYVPPLFTKETRDREILITPFQTMTEKTEDPFNVIFSFGVGGFVMNLENHVREFKRGFYPRLYHLTASTINETVEDITATQFCYSTGSIKKRNLTILPNDNGKFTPDYEILNKPKYSKTKFSSSYGGIDLSIISLEDMVSEDAIFTGLSTVSPSDIRAAIDGDSSTMPDDESSTTMAALVAGVTPESFGGTSGPILTVAQRTRDRSSNEICFFDISNIYYGNRIQPGSLYVTDLSVTGSDDKMSITLSDNGKGGLYRSDAEGPNPTWANAGNCLYEEGIVFVKSPSLTFFGKDKFEMRFKGEQNVHIATYNINLSAGMFNSSSNPQYKLLSASASPSDIGEKFVYIDSVNLHDENLNVIMRSNFSQPIKKRVSDSMVVRFKMDF
tara:strand:- start:8297 stop:10759 length:2463 start_codon:yes stop_codon:yes gene_type:complete